MILIIKTPKTLQIQPSRVILKFDFIKDDFLLFSIGF